MTKRERFPELAPERKSFSLDDYYLALGDNIFLNTATGVPVGRKKRVELDLAGLRWKPEEGVWRISGWVKKYDKSGDYYHQGVAYVAGEHFVLKWWLLEQGEVEDAVHIPPDKLAAIARKNVREEILVNRLVKHLESGDGLTFLHVKRWGVAENFPIIVGWKEKN
ncbi:hypothetical protein A3A60_00345 [Candidatus Curtissbacteria bacterium RIFCSPLOWO2_01_FULL_42_26]|uniref:Uncharacterized protein n=1 Tax=Candidatus Curtissbacteria bacterium RIFCSPLOWO2_01_FULL_42_26 TaxID=1797729 RepID=A0A1F5HWI2_9BACT|nr:MAG: hypothetical protein A3A60_00345 [Candidatus Curtissbacteria bacterium RIFCSPLOWO2_01_FULL_42_26]